MGVDARLARQSVARGTSAVPYRRSDRRDAGRVVGLALLVAGLLAVAGGAAWQLQLLPGSEVVLPAPVAFNGRPGVREVRAAQTQPGFSTQPDSTTQASATTPPAPSPADAAQLNAAGASDAATALPAPGVAQRLVIASIGVDTPVVDGGMQQTASGVWEWQTVPFVAVHYAELTALVGAHGNAVLAGHVSTRQQGNVFINLYRVELGDQVQVWDDSGVEHDFSVASVRLVSPSDTSVMNQTPNPTLTLMTCGGTFDPIHREFSDRLVVSATLS